MVQFLTNRMSDTTYLKDVDDRYQDLEDAFLYFFGVPVDTPFYKKVTFVDVDGNLVSILKQAKPFVEIARQGAGWRNRDTSTDDEFMLICGDGYLRIYENVNTQALPNWQERNKMALADGVWDVVSKADIGTGCGIREPYGSIDIRAGAFMEFEWEIFDDGDYWSTAARDRFIIPADGRYNVQWCCGLPAVTTYYQVELMTTLYLNGTPVIQMGSGQKEEITAGPPVKPGIGVGGEWTFGALSASDYIQFHFECWSWNDDVSALSDGHAMIERIA